MPLLEPKKYKHRKVRKGKNDGKAGRGNFVAFGEWGLQSLDNSDVTGRQLESARQAISRRMNRGGKLWIRVFPHIPVSRKPQDVKMGSGKGDLAFWAAKVKEGTVLFEIAGVDEVTAKDALRLAGHKMPVRVKIIARDETLAKGPVIIGSKRSRADVEAEQAEQAAADAKANEEVSSDNGNEEKKEGDK